MDDNKFLTYVKLFSDLYEEGKMKAKWSIESGAIRPLVDVEEELKKTDPLLTEEEFIQAAFQIIRITRDLSLGVALEEGNEGKANIIKEVFLSKNVDLLDYINVHSSSSVNVFEDMQYEILTKRSKNDVNHILGHSVVLQLYYSDPVNVSDEDRNQRMVIEMTKGEIEQMMRKLGLALEALTNMDKR